MESSANNQEVYGRNSDSRRLGIPMPESSFILTPLTALLEQTGIFGVAASDSRNAAAARSPTRRSLNDSENGNRSDDEDGGDGDGAVLEDEDEDDEDEDEVSIRIIGGADPAGVSEGGGGGEGSFAEYSGSGMRESSYPRYNSQHFARWLVQVLPFTLLLLLVFVQQHYQGFSVAIWIGAVMFKSNDVVQKQTALKAERKVAVLVGISSVFVVHVICFYWLYRKDDLLYPLALVPPKSAPPLWNAMFIIMVNDIMARQAGIAFKCMILVCFKDSKGRQHLKQGQMLTLVEYFLLLYRALLPTPVWYRYFQHREYGSFFSSLIIGVYLTFKLKLVVDKVQSFFVALRALSRKEVHYGSYATSEQVNAAGDLCAICQEKMHAPIILCCKHLFCEDCVSEWFDRERTCPLCRAMVKPASIKSYSDGSTSMFFQLC